MSHMERLHLKHVLQIVGALEEVVRRIFGPEGGQVLFTRDTGQAMLTRSGIQILTALHLDHPLARTVVDCVRRHCAKTGDGSKTFVLLLASLLRLTAVAAGREVNVARTHSSRDAAETAAAKRLADSLLAFALEELADVIAVGVVPHGCSLPWSEESAGTNFSAHTNTNSHSVRNLLASFFLTRLGCTHCDFFSGLTSEFLSLWRSGGSPPSTLLHFIDDNFPALHTAVSGVPVNSSRVLEGQVIHRDFATPCRPPNQQPVKAAVLECDLQPSVLGDGFILELGGGEQNMEKETTRRESSTVQFCSSAERSLQFVLGRLRSLGVSLLLSATKQSEAALTVATHAEMSVVECVDKEELALFTYLSGVAPISDRRQINQENVATLTFCRPVLLGDHRYVHVSFHEPERTLAVNPHSLVMCGTGEAQTEQYLRALRDAVHMLRVTWEPTFAPATTASQRPTETPPPGKIRSRYMLEPGCVITAGGTFEFLLHHSLLHRGLPGCNASSDVSVLAAIKLLASAVLSVPQRLYSYSPHLFLQMQTQVVRSVQSHAHPVECRPKDDTVPRPACGQTELRRHGRADAAPRASSSSLDLGLESVSCKYQLVLAVLQCLSSLLRFDLVLRTRTVTRTRPRRNPSSSQESEEEEDTQE